MNRRGPPSHHPPAAATTTAPPQSNNNDQQPSPTQPSWTPQKLLTSSYKSLGSPQQVANQFQQCLLSSNKTLPSILSILLSEPGKTGIFDYSLQVDMHDFICMDPVLGNMLLRHPMALLPLLEEAIVAAQREVMRKWNDFQDLARLLLIHHQQQQQQQPVHMNMASSSSFIPVVKGEKGTRVHARLIHLPPHHTNCKPSLSNLTSQDVGKILQLSGTVVRTSRVQMYESHRTYKCCPKKGCGSQFTIKAELNQWNNALNYPSRCPNRECKCKNFLIVPEGTSRSDYQEIKVQETLSHNGSFGGGGMGNGGVSTIPKTLLIKLQHDLVDQCQPGDDVVVVGTLMSHWLNNLVHMSDVQIGMAMEAHSIRVVNGGDGSGTSGSSWDCIFNSMNNDEDEDEDDEDNDNHGGGMKKRMVRDEIVREFEDYWNDDMNKKHPIAARNFICKAVCPTLYGLSLVKISLLLVLIGGSNDAATATNLDIGNVNDNNRENDEGGVTDAKHYSSDNEDGEGIEDEMQLPVQFSLDGNNDDDGDNKISKGKLISSQRGRKRRITEVNKSNHSTVHTRRREQSHLLLVGDPGCGKSQFLKFATALCPRSVLASGSGTTSAGLTCAAVREDSSKEWTLEAGALVLADRGVCAIDEFSCINPKDRTTIHEAMEQQTLSVAKAGIVAKLNCRATVIAVTNAKSGYYDHDKSFSINVGIEPPLLSRFDLIFKLIDGSDVNKDDKIATFLLNRAIQGSGYDCSKAHSRSFGRKDIWGIEKLRAYIATVKSRFRPSLSVGSSTLLERHYSACRSSVDMAIQITVRFLESLIRLAQAHASLMHREIVQLDDAIAVIILMESSVASLNNYNSLGDDPTSDFPDDDDADINFVMKKVKILEKYNMQENISMEEYRMVQNEQSRLATDMMANGWDDYHNSAQTFQEMDHYGRFTQKSTPSPPKFHIPGLQLEGTVQVESSKRKPPTFSAD